MQYFIVRMYCLLTALSRHIAKYRLPVCALYALFLPVFSIQAQTYYHIVPATGASFLRTPGDISQTAMGNAAIAGSSNAYSGFSNAAKIPYGPSMAFVAGYTPWFSNFGTNGAYLLNFGFLKSIGSDQGFALNWRYCSLGTVIWADGQGNQIGQYKPSEMDLEGAYSLKLSNKVNIAATLKYIHSGLISGTIDQTVYHAGNTLAADAAFLYNGENEQNEGITAGIVVSNLGGKLRYTDGSAGKTFLPANLGLGIAYKLVPGNEDLDLLFALDLNKLLVPALPASTGVYDQDSVALLQYSQQSIPGSWLHSFADGSNQVKDVRISLGAECMYLNTFFFRMGYYTTDKSIGNTKYLTLGLGLKWKGIGLDLAYLLPASNTGTVLSQSPFQKILQLGVSFSIEPKDVY